MQKIMQKKNIVSLRDNISLKVTYWSQPIKVEIRKLYEAFKSMQVSHYWFVQMKTTYIYITEKTKKPLLNPVKPLTEPIVLTFYLVTQNYVISTSNRL